MTNPSLVILSGGLGKRMGGKDKSRIVWRGKLFLEHILDSLGPLTSDILIAGAPPYEADAYTDMGLVVYPDSFPSHGPVAGLETGLRNAQGDIAFCCACDMPLIQPKVVGRLIEKLGTHDAVVPRVNGYPQPLHAVYRTHVAEKAQTLLERGACPVTDLLDAIDVLWVEEDDLSDIPSWRQSFRNINTPDELGELEETQ